ncbi:hypothetical protein BDY17DRAFT_119804 [Neohortaea acidophila]|uniref:GATA-type domain-containing protein n=1 Tax=Neohortaea acidophila TaxID=245834 RepID=A0A6A6PWB9_9PEZI|nr:uncharacterized protein BDY17DRAFT_119804 [Neohortaea acidophila]KAF2484031.1 hypothetical protein BDY17DRAFT_119804 [Neohortaea acidophila]
MCAPSIHTLTRNRPQLPALSYLDVEKEKSEHEAFPHERNVGAQSTPSETSPSSARPLGSSAPYSHPASQANTTSRRTSGEVQDNPKQVSRQSLPSISEALGVDTHTPFSTSGAQASSQTATPSSPSPSFRRLHGTEAPPPIHPHSSYPRDSAGPPPYPPVDSIRPAAQPRAEPGPHMPPPPQAAAPERVEKANAQYEHSSHSASNHMPPPSFSYGYASYAPRYADTAPPPPSAGPIYQPSSQYAPPATSTSSWRSDSATSHSAPDERGPPPSAYEESVKRHLDLYDLEAALNDVSQTSSIVLDFSRRYGDRMHQTARSTPALFNLPSIVEVDDMMSKSRHQLDALSKIRDVVVTQQITYEQELAQQRQQAKAYREGPTGPSNGVADDPQQSLADHSDDGGFAGSEPKKRRGRAAPPGRCHSCNRAETPEWRRGPDGARTLCNACGLHYAKLTRKQTNASKSATTTTTSNSSNLRPKES